MKDSQALSHIRRSTRWKKTGGDLKIYKPTRTPYAFVTDWPGVGPGWGVPWEQVEEVARFEWPKTSRE